MKPRGLVLVPTRELANQVLAVVEPLARTAGLTVMTIFGGVGQNPQVRALRAGTDIVIACPGRLEDLVGQGHCDLGSVEITVLDEADHMADLGFLPGVRRLMDRTPKVGQRLLFSATLDRGVDVLVKRYLSNPVTHQVDPVETRSTDMVHHVFTVASGDKAAIVRDLASGRGRSVLFMRTKHQAKKLAKQLTESGIPAVDLHGNLSQSARERNLASFTDGTSRVLVATDIAARGIHVDEVALVVHVDPPAEHKAYLHRSGRTARAGAAGIVVTIATADQSRDVTALTRQAGISPTVHARRAGQRRGGEAPRGAGGACGARSRGCARRPGASHVPSGRPAQPPSAPHALGRGPRGVGCRGDHRCVESSRIAAQVIAARGPGQAAFGPEGELRREAPTCAWLRARLQLGAEARLDEAAQSRWPSWQRSAWPRWRDRPTGQWWSFTGYDRTRAPVTDGAHSAGAIAGATRCAVRHGRGGSSDGRLGRPAQVGRDLLDVTEALDGVGRRQRPATRSPGRRGSSPRAWTPLRGR